jgi:hypothetical protein
LLYSLLDYAQALAHLFHPDTVSVIAITVYGGGNIEFKFVINRIRRVFPDIPFYPGTA